MSDTQHQGLHVEASDKAAPVNRYASVPAWRAVDDYFTTALVTEDAALVAARGSGAKTTMPNAEIVALTRVSVVAALSSSPRCSGRIMAFSPVSGA